MDLKILKILGQLMGLALAYNCQIEMKFPEIFYSILLKNIQRRDYHFKIEDIKDTEPEIYQTLINIGKNLED